MSKSRGADRLFLFFIVTHQNSILRSAPGTQVYTANQAVVPLEIGRWECMWQDDEGQWGIIEYHDTFRMPNFKKPLTPLGKLVTVAEGDLNLRADKTCTQHAVLGNST